MLIYGPKDFYADHPNELNLIETVHGKLVVRHLQANGPVLYTQLPPMAGIWCGYLRLEISQKAYMHRVCFEWLPGKSVAFISCPDHSILDFL